MLTRRETKLQLHLRVRRVNGKGAAPHKASGELHGVTPGRGEQGVTQLQLATRFGSAFGSLQMPEKQL